MSLRTSPLDQVVRQLKALRLSITARFVLTRSVSAAVISRTWD
ncbi:hypothetical protein [Advenella mandrilli]|nr:hypothetical protein [Advenella mandrilli]